MKKIILIIIYAFNYSFGYSQIIAAGGYHTLAICVDNTVLGWGHNYFGQRGDGNNVSSYSPVQSVQGNVAAVYGGLYHSLFLLNDSTVWSCGWNDYGQLGDGTIVDRLSPVQVNSLSGLIVAAAG